MKSDKSTPNVPTLRFKQYDDKWTICNLSDIASVVGGGTPDTTDPLLWNGNVQWFTPTEVGHSKYVSKSVRTISRLGLQKSSAKVLPQGSILLSSRATVGECSIVKNECTTNQGFQSLIPRKGINNEFLYYLSQTKKKHFIKYASGSTFLEISNSEIKKTKCAVPCIDEQAKIAEFLSLLDEKIETQNKIIEDLKILKKELCRKMLSSITEHKTLGELCSITTGKLDANANNLNGLYPFFTCGKDTLSIDNYAFDGEAILIAGNGDIGHTKYYYGKFNAYQRTYVLMGFKADAQFIKMGIDTYLPQKISEETQGGAMPYIKLSTLTSLKIPFTTEEKQLSIRNHYDTIAQKVENETKVLDLLLQQKSYFLNAMFI
ncbi:MAG: restriction endonuclease subunit S [Candidatus Borkfalkiaceae bacterium]|nr:restriction endonuclease subunit S [Christensenellaceae bacterium]